MTGNDGQTSDPIRVSVEAILFDAGGTLILADGERACRAAGIPYDAGVFARAQAAAFAQIRSWIRSHPESTDGQRLPVFLEAILRELGLDAPEDRRAAGAKIAAEHARSNLWSHPAEAALATLEELSRRGYRLGVISNADGRVRALLEEAGLASRLEFILDSSEIGVEKPHPRIFQAAADRLALPASACAYVGDIYEIDILGARSAGMRAVLIGSGDAPEPIERVLDLPALLAIFPERRA